MECTIEDLKEFKILLVSLVAIVFLIFVFSSIWTRSTAFSSFDNLRSKTHFIDGEHGFISTAFVASIVIILFFYSCSPEHLLHWLLLCL